MRGSSLVRAEAGPESNLNEPGELIWRDCFQRAARSRLSFLQRDEMFELLVNANDRRVVSGKEPVHVTFLADAAAE